MVQSCRESAQTSTKYIAASAKWAEEHHALLEAILSQQLNNKENTSFSFFFFFFPESEKSNLSLRYAPKLLNYHSFTALFKKKKSLNAAPCCIFKWNSTTRAHETLPVETWHIAPDFWGLHSWVIQVSRTQRGRLLERFISVSINNECLPDTGTTTLYRQVSANAVQLEQDFEAQEQARVFRQV